MRKKGGHCAEGGSGAQGGAGLETRIARAPACVRPGGSAVTLGGVKIYTRTGDDGTTGVLGPGRLPKSAPRIDAYGQVDELNATLGAARAHDREGELDAELASIQAMLFQLGAELATTSEEALAKLRRISEDDVAGLEATIDRLDASLPPLASFVLPAGTTLATQLHVARTVCRRAERAVVGLAEKEKIEPRLIRYLNRLADLLFVMARWSNHRSGIAEKEWKGK